MQHYPMRCFDNASPREAITKLLIEKLKLQLPSQPPPRLVAQKDDYKIEVQSVR